jgi:predicted HTH domain antitoxin
MTCPKEGPLNISIELPDEIADQIGSQWADLPRRALESLVADAYRESVISGPQAQQMLGFNSRLELDAFLKRARVFLDYSEEDLAADIQTLDELLGE